jgi:hypothetical protein
VHCRSLPGREFERHVFSPPFVMDLDNKKPPPNRLFTTQNTQKKKKHTKSIYNSKISKIKILFNKKHQQKKSHNQDTSHKANPNHKPTEHHTNVKKKQTQQDNRSQRTNTHQPHTYTFISPQIPQYNSPQYRQQHSRAPSSSINNKSIHITHL